MGGTVNVNGGYIEATYQGSSGYGIYLYNGSAKTYINGGEIRGYYGIYNSIGTVEVTDGKVIGTGAYGIAANGTTNIYGGRIEGKTYGVYSNASDKITLGRQEDELSTTSPAVYGETYGIYLSNETYSFNFYNGKIISNTKETAYRGQVNLRTGHMPYTYFDYDIEQKYCTILVPTVEKITMEATPTEYTNGDVTVKITYPYNTDTKQYSENGNDWIDAEQYIQEIIVTENKTIYARTINESGMVIDENKKVINNIDKEKPTVTVTPTQTNYVVTETNGTVDLNIIIAAQDTGVSGLNVMQYAWAKEGEEPTYINFTNTITINKTKLEIGQYNLYVNVTDKAGNKSDLMQIRYNVKYQEPVAQIGSTKYTTIQDAINACSKSAGNTQTTIIMLKSTDEEFITYEGQNIKLDLKGYTVGSSSTETPICTNVGTLQIIDTSTNKTGKLESLNGTAIQNNGTITIGDNSASIENDTPTIYGYKIGVENNNIFNFYDGKIQGVTPIKGNTTDTPAEFGPVSTDYNNGITTVQLGIVSGYEARIEWVYYTTVQEAVDATKVYKDGSRDTVTLIKDIQLKNTLNISSNKDMILDLNRYVLTISTEKDTVIENNGKLEITDSSIEQIGEITINSSNTGTYNNKLSTIAIKNNNLGQLIISGGNINSIITGTYNYVYGIYNENEGIVEVTGGTISSNSSSGGNYADSYGIYNSKGIVKVVGGKVSSRTSGSNHCYGIHNATSGTVKVSGGIVDSENSGTYNYIYGIYNYGNGEVTVESGNISGKSGIYNYGNGSVIIKGGNVTGTTGIYNNREGNIIVENGTITGKSDKIAIGIYNYSAGLVTIKGGTISSNSSNGGVNDHSYGIYNYNNGTVTIENGIIESINNYAYSYGIYNSKGIVTIIDGIISSIGNYYSSYGIYNSNTGDIIIGSKNDEIVSQEKPLIMADYTKNNNKYNGYGIYNLEGNIYFYDGIIKGNKATTGNIFKEIMPGYKIDLNIIDKKETICLIENFEKENIVQIDDKKYNSVTEAIESIGEEEKTIKVLKSFELNEALEFNKNIILDLNGYTITNKYYKIVNKGKLKITDTTANKNGKLECIETVIGISNNSSGNLTIEGVNIDTYCNIGDFTSYGIYNSDNGTVRIVEGTINHRNDITFGNTIYNYANGIILVEGGTINSDYYGIYNNSDGIVEMSNGDIYSTGYGIINNSGYVYIKEGTVYGEIKGVHNHLSGTIEVTGGTISSNRYGIYNNYSSGTIKVINGIINCSATNNSGYGIYNANSGEIIIGTKGDGLVSQEEPLITSESSDVGYGIYNTQGNLYYYDGRIEGTTKAIYNFITEREENTELNYNEDETVVTLSTDLIDIAQIGDTTYKTLQEAIDAVGIGQATIKILRNVTYTVNDTKVVIPNNKNIIIDLNGYKISSSIEETFIQNEGILEILDTSENKTGHLTSNTETTIRNISGAKLTITGGTIENIKQTTIYNEGDLIINGGELINNIGPASNSNSYVIYNNNMGNVEIISGLIDNNNYFKYNGSTNYSNNYFGIFNNSTGFVKIVRGIVATHNLYYISSRNNSYGIYNANSGNIKIDGGTIESINENDYTASKNNCYGIYNVSSGNIELTTGTIFCSVNGGTSYSDSEVYGIYNANIGIITIGKKEDEIFSKEKPIITVTYAKNQGDCIGYGIYNPNGTLNYYDGKIQGKDIALNGKISEIEELTELVISTETVEDEELQTLILKQIATNAVTMNGTEYESLSKAIKASGSTQNTIKLLRDIGLSSDAIIEANQNIIIDLNGYTISNYNAITNKGTLKIIDSSAGQTGKIINTILGTAISNIGTMELNSGNISDSAYGIKNTGTLNITGGTIQNNSYGIYNDANGTVTITSGEITSNTYGIYNYDATAVTNINSGSISSNEYGIYNYNGTTNINSSGIANNTTYGIYNAGGTTNIKEGSQVQSQTGIYVVNGTVNIGKQGTMNPDSPVIIGEEFGLEVSPTGTVYMYDGQIKGKQGATQGFVTHTETGYAVANKVDGEYYVDYLALAGTISTVAEVNGVSFSNLQSAINSVVGEEPQTVKLTNGIITTMTINILEGQNIILDMSGKTISSDLSLTINNAGTLVIIDSASSGVAKISSTVGTAINNTGTLILGQDDGTVAQDIITIEGQTYGITTSGTLNFYDGTINGASAVNGTVTNRPSGYVIRTTTVNGKERYYLSAQ